MIIKEAKYDKDCACGAPGKKISDTRYGCDECNKQYGHDGFKHPLTVDIHIKSEIPHQTPTRDFCSWECLLKSISEIGDCDSFMALPYLTFDDRGDGHMAADFFKAIKAFGK